MIDRMGRVSDQLKGKTDTFKDVVIDTSGHPDFKLGDYCEVKINKVKGKTMFAHPIEATTIKKFSEKSQGQPYFIPSE